MQGNDAAAVGLDLLLGPECIVGNELYETPQVEATND